MKNKILNILISAFYLFATALVIIEYLTRTNFILDLLKVDYFDVFVISTIFVFVKFIFSEPLNIVKKHYRKIIFFFPVFLLTGSLIIFMRYHQLYLILEQEDSVIETLQFIFIMLSCFTAFYLAKKYKKTQSYIYIIFYLIAICFLFIGGEEISWGQRIFNIITPKSLSEINLQNETNIHNIKSVFGFVYKAYMLVGFVGATLWMIKGKLIKQFRNNKDLKFISKTIIPDWYYSSYFLAVFLYNFDKQIIHLRPGYALWEELIELILFICLSLFLFDVYLQRNKKL